MFAGLTAAIDPTAALLEAAYGIAVLGARVLRLRSIRRAADDEAEANTYDLPDGAPIAAELRDWLAKQKAAVLDAIPNDTIPETFPDLTADQWTDPMAKAMTPILGAYWDESGKEVFGRLGLDPDDWRVTNPHLEAQIHSQALAFCQSTNDTTSRRLDDALTQLRAELVKGMVEEGESVRELAKRVRSVFEGLSKSHATMIATTEASRAVHAAELTADIESEVVEGLELLISSDACPLCRKIATECRRVRLGQSFAVIGNHPDYSHIKHPPLHPRCQCTCIEVLKPEYGGPVAPEWGHTLQQPQKGLGSEYTPPPDRPEPKPEPKRPKPRPIKPPPKAKPVPAEKAAIDRARDYAKAKGVKIVTAANDLIERTQGKRKAVDIPAVYYRGTKTVLINEKCSYWKAPAEWMAANNKKTPPWFSTSEADHIIVHEVGHAEHNKKVGDDRYKEVVDRKFTAAEKALVAAHVSRYGATEPVEFVAEMYAGLVAKKDYNQEVSLLYLSLGGPIP